VKNRNTDASAHPVRGFSLVEVNLAILLVGVGLFALFALFPRGLQESDMAVQDTHEAMFANAVISAIEGCAADITDWDEWLDLSAIQARLREVPGMENITFHPISGGIKAPSTSDPFVFPRNSVPQRYITYQLQIFSRDDVQPKGKIVEVVLKVASGRNRSINQARYYYTELMFMGE